LNTDFPKYYLANGKLLLTSEYFVLDGAKALAVPTKFYQEMHVSKSENEGIFWESLDENNEVWFSCQMSKNIELSIYSDKDIAETLVKIIHLAINNDKTIDFNNLHVRTKTNFNRNFGLGTSSTLISLIAQWTNANPYFLLENSFGGSGYDIACATSKSAILYQIQNENRNIESTHFLPPFRENIYFIYLENKQNSREGIQYYKSINQKNKQNTIEQLNDITNKIISCNNIYEFNTLIEKHEQLVSSQLHMSPIKATLFSNFSGSIKSLGAWGGDFIMACSDKGADYIQQYFKEKKYNNIISFNDMVLD